MQYRVTHTTKYAYTEPVPVCHNMVHLAPRATPRQPYVDFRLLIIPEPTEVSSYDDFFGNRVDYFSMTDAHRGLSVTATDLIEVKPPQPLPNDEDSPPWEEIVQGLDTLQDSQQIENRLFAFSSDYASTDPMFAEYARASFPPGKPIVSAIRDLTRRIFTEFEYDPRATNVSTPVEEVLAQKSGVCQDFAHLGISCLRSLGLAARYVSGYLRTEPPEGTERLVGADASHAWYSVFCGPLGWIDFDPTNDMITSTDHITVAYGRDYGDVCPIQGVFVGGGEHSMSVSVDVQLLSQ